MACYPGVAAVASRIDELAAAAAVIEAGGRLALVGPRDAAWLRGATTGKNKSVSIEADVLTQAGYDLAPLNRASSRSAPAPLPSRPAGGRWCSEARSWPVSWQHGVRGSVAGSRARLVRQDEVDTGRPVRAES
jgi:hypothetical protein